MHRKQPYIMMVVPSLPEQGGGGLVQVVGYLGDAWQHLDNVPPMRMLVTRGRWGIWLSPFYLLRAMAVMISACRSKDVALVHLNLSVQGSTWRKICIAAIANHYDVPVVLHLHGSDYITFFASLRGWKRQMVCSLFHNAAVIAVLGMVWRNFVIDEIGADPAAVTVVYNGVPESRTGDGLSAKDQRESIKRITFLGRLGKRKGLPELLHALASPRLEKLRWTATLAGDGEVAQTRARISEQGLSTRVSVPGWVSGVEAKRILMASDIFVLPSHDEGLSIALLEAMAAGCAIVTTPVGAHGEVIDDGENGILIPAGDREALVEAMSQLLQDDNLCMCLGENARRRFQKHFTSAELAEKFREIYAALYAEPSPSSNDR